MDSITLFPVTGRWSIPCHQNPFGWCSYTLIDLKVFIGAAGFVLLSAVFPLSSAIPSNLSAISVGLSALFALLSAIPKTGEPLCAF
ncbi:hypothetical protein [Lentibacillus daqui]|uniref:hypothetical protein n=1 Tax=Lentibacillus daqui TaxID=2911514 RepID=UPI0022B19844|nr:hypothetical protein [Lentibacillus daqui]